MTVNSRQGFQCVPVMAVMSEETPPSPSASDTKWHIKVFDRVKETVNRPDIIFIIVQFGTF